MKPALWLVALLVACAPAAPEGAPSARPVAATPKTPAAPLEPLGLGRPATEAEIAAWDHDVDPSGKALPPGSGTAEVGATLYLQKCAACHGRNGEGNLVPHASMLIGGAPKDADFASDYKLMKTVGNHWPYATTLFDYLQRAMPQTQPGSLTPDETYALTAYLLSANGVVPPGFVADKTSLPAVVMPGRGRFVPDDRTGGAEFR